MRDLARLLSLPATLLVLSLASCADAQDIPWPYNLPRTAKYYPEDEAHVKRGLEAQERLAMQTPTGVKKMGHDPSEKFYLDYWDFELDLGTYIGDTAMRRPLRVDGLQEYTNATGICQLLAPHAPHVESNGRALSIFRRSIFGRDFQCPAGTNSCSNIGSDLCCNTGETCVNTSNGVGCCPNGRTCGNTVAGCDTAAGYTDCPNSDNGGCCVPGAVCYQSGCAFYGTVTSVTTLPTRTVTSGTTFIVPSSSHSTTAQPTTVVISPSGYTTTVTISQQGSTITETVVSPTTIVIIPATASTCSSGFSSCASSLGGGCCRNGQTCATNSCIDPSSSTSTATAAPPVRPTTSASSSNSPVSVADTTVSSSAVAGCPTGYYMCSAVYLGGCCQVDRNCDTTSCPATASTDIVTSGITIAAGAGAAATCAGGWTSCAADVGGGCCPSGYACGTASCSNSQGGGVQAKQTPTSTAVVHGFAWSFALVALGAAVGMIWL